MSTRNLAIVAAVFAVIAALFCYLWASKSFFNESKLVGDWEYSFRDDYFPRYATKLKFDKDGSFSKTEEYTGFAGGPTAVTTFAGAYSTGPNTGIGKIFVAVNQGAASLEGEVVKEIPTGGYGAAFHFAFDQSGNLIIADNVDTLSGHSKNPAQLDRFVLLPSWGAFSRKQ